MIKFLPVLVESTTAVFRHVLCPYGKKGTETMRSLDVADHADSHHGWSLDNRDSLYDLLFVDLWKVITRNIGVIDVLYEHR